MNYNISLTQMNRLGKVVLSKQPKVTLKEAIQQVQTIKKNSRAGQKKKGH